MKFLPVLWLSGLAALAASRLAPMNGMKHHNPSNPISPRQTEPEKSDEEHWAAAVCRGKNLVRAMEMDDEEKIKTLFGWDHVQSPWEGELWPELIFWGYDEDTATDDDANCDFDEKHGMARAFQDLDINPYPVGPEAEGHNKCYKVKHQDGLTVEIDNDGKMQSMPNQWYTAEGKRYRSTGGFAHIGVNGPDGAIFFFERVSPEHAARLYWKVKKANPEELPKLRASSDLAWGCWNRVTDDESINEIKYIMALDIINIVTAPIIIPRALSHVGFRRGELTEWPGAGFLVDGETILPNDSEGVKREKQGRYDAAYALIGLPNGIGAAYFLLQHKRQLGGSKSIMKVVVFKGDENENNVFDYANLLFVVDNDPRPPPEPEDPDVPMEDVPHVATSLRGNLSRIVKRSENGRSILREHELMVKFW